MNRSESGKLGMAAMMPIRRAKEAKRLADYLVSPSLCKYCSTALSYEKRHNKYCSHSCSAIASNTGRKIIRKNPKQYYYCECGKKIAKKSLRCRECLKKYTGSLTIGEYRERERQSGRHPSWLHSSVRNLGKAWNKDLETACISCGYDKHVEVCHVIPIASYPDTALLSEVNARSNIVVLCPNCHWEFDNKLLSLDNL